MNTFRIIIFSALLLFSCASTEAPKNLEIEVVEYQGKEFNAYWYAGQAELSTYTLSQARYGEMREGESVLIFVTEEFLIDKQVKKETDTQDPSTSVLKMNKIDRFTTGIYDYSLMLSTFLPVNQTSFPYIFKTSFSSQDWCGQSFMQLNRREAGYQALVRSYFEQEGDKSQVLPDLAVEDALWTLARLDPRLLPQGEFDIIPSSAHVRLDHVELSPEQVKGQLRLEMKASGEEQYIYHLIFESGRELRIYLQTVFPFRIYGWEEKSKQGDKWLTSKATLKASKKSSYWGEHSSADDEKRKELKLD